MKTSLLISLKHIIILGRFSKIDFMLENIRMLNRTYYNREMSNGHGNIPAINNFSLNKTFICRSLLLKVKRKTYKIERGYDGLLHHIHIEYMHEKVWIEKYKKQDRQHNIFYDLSSVVISLFSSFFGVSKVISTADKFGQKFKI